MKRYYDGEITELRSHEIFVFGSNSAGIHGAAAALLAKKKFGAINGQGSGLQGASYAIPTQNHETWRGLPLGDIKDSVDIFLEFANGKPAFDFLVIPIGCGYAGYRPSDIAFMFEYAPANVVVPICFYDAIKLQEVDPRE